MYNRASADPAGNPWPKEARLARQFGTAAQGLRLLGRRRRRPRPADPAKTVKGRWVGLDVPDFPSTSRRRATAKPDGLGLDFHDGASPFIMKADGKGWLFAPSGLGRRPAARPTTSRTNRRSPNLVYPGAAEQPGGQGLPRAGQPLRRRRARPSTRASSRPTG